MGGKHETTIPQPAGQKPLRIHVNNGEVHVHDDDKKIKMIVDAEDWEGKYLNLRHDATADGSAIICGDNGVDLICKVISDVATFELASRVKGFEDFDAFTEKL